MRPYRRPAAIVGAASLLSGAVEAAFLVVVTRIALALTNGDAEVRLVASRATTVMGATLVGSALLVARLAFALASLWASSSVTIDSSRLVRRRLAGGYLRSSWSTQQGQPPGHLQELLISFSAAAAGVVGAMVTILSGVLSLGALLTVSFAVNPEATLAVALALVGLGAVLAPFRARIRGLNLRSAEAQLAFAESVSELGSLGLEMQVYGVRDEFADAVAALIDRESSVRHRAMLMTGALPVVYTTLAYTAVLVGLWAVSVLVDGELAGVAAVMLVMLRTLSYGQQLQVGMASLNGSMPYLDLLDRTIEHYESQPAPVGNEPIDEIGEIAFHRVSFGYDPEHLVLRDLSFTIKPGEVIGIVGPSGGGKSSLVQLLLGLREPSAGEITIGGVGLPRIDRGSWSDRVALVAQDALLPSGTVRESIAFFRDRIKPGDVLRSAELANIASEIEAMPAKFEQQVGSRGGRLSGGQRQRVSIARALAGNPQLLVLDEPTSALDVKSEALIRTTIEKLRGVTIVIVAHRLSTLNTCDRIMVLQHGEVKAFAPAAELARNDLFFREVLDLSAVTGTPDGPHRP